MENYYYNLNTKQTKHFASLKTGEKMVIVVPDNIYCGDCLELMRGMKDKSVDLVLQDPPYNTTSCHWEWDIMTKIEEFWVQWKRIIKPNGAIVMTASQPFTSKLVMSNLKMFKYCWVWEKDKGTNFLQASYQPMKLHEDIIIFYNNIPIYNPQKEIPKSTNSLNRMGRSFNAIKRLQGQYLFKGKQNRNFDELKFPESIIYFKREIGNNQFIKDKVLHPTQKPVALFEYLIKTYTNEGDIAFDGFLGSGTTAVACIRTNRRYIGMEIDPTYYAIAKKRIEQEKMQLKLDLK